MDPKGQALIGLLARAKPAPGGSDAKGASDSPGDYDADLKAALGDLAAALGVQVKDAERGVEALKTIHDLCDRASGEE